MTTKILPELLTLIKENRKFLIVSHVSPEGDAIGSSLALALGLKKIGKSVYILNRDAVPDIFRFLPSSMLVTQKIPAGEFDVLFIVDCPNLERTGLKNLRAKTTIVIDHHLVLPGDATKQAIHVIDSDASATGELIYKLLSALDIPIDKAIAVNLYTAILTDTGGFKYSNTNPESLKISSQLVEAGADPWVITKEVYEKVSFNRMKLLGLSLATIEMKENIASMTISRHMFKQTKTSTEDTENFVDYPRKIRDIDVAVLFREDGKNLYKISFRAKGKINVARVAGIFGGGGHASAAGCQVTGSLSAVKKKVFRAVRNEIRMHNIK